MIRKVRDEKENLKKIDKTTKIKPEKIQSWRDRALPGCFLLFFVVVFFSFFSDFFARVANVNFQCLH